MIPSSGSHSWPAYTPEGGTANYANHLITGTSTGIGHATALAFGRSGHTVFATMRNPARSPQLAETAAAEHLPIKVSVMDVDSDTSVKEAIAAIHAQAGHIDVLINNAGVERMGSVEETPLSDFRAIMETNYLGAIRCVQAVVGPMRERRSGCIISISSVAGRMAISPMAPYAASKFALEALSECLAHELKTFNVRVAIVEPGIIDTPMAQHVRVGRGGDTHYAQQRRFGHLFTAALANHPPVSIVSAKILDIVESGTWQLRHPVGPDAEPFLGWRATMTDEQFADLNSADDDAWYSRLEGDFGMTIRPAK